MYRCSFALRNSNWDGTCKIRETGVHQFESVPTCCHRKHILNKNIEKEKRFRSDFAHKFLSTCVKENFSFAKISRC